MDTEVRVKRNSSNKKIDRALNALMRNVDKLAPDTAVKVLATAIAWEKAKAKIAESENEFDPDNL